MILVTGATGRIGRRVINRLVDQGQEVRALVRNKEKAEMILPDGTELVIGDLGDEDVIRAATEGATSILLLSPVSPDQVRLQGNVVKAAASGSRPYILKVSGLGTSLDSTVDSGRWHAETEEDIRLAELPFTFIRPLFFYQNLDFLFESAKKHQVIRAGVGNAKIAMVDVDDIAELSAKLLSTKLLSNKRLQEQASLMNQAVTITALDAVSYEEVAKTMSDILGFSVRYEEQPLEEVEAALRKGKQPQWHIDILLQFNRAFIEGYGDAASNVLADTIGRTPTRLAQYLQRSLNQHLLDDGSNPFPS